MLNSPFPPWPAFSADEADAVAQTLLSGRVNYWTGDAGRLFETEFAEAIEVRHAVALNNGTVALDVSLHALGIGAGDEVIVTPRSFIASTSCVVLAGATPVFVDVDRDSQNITAETIAPAVTRRTKAVIPVHLAGMPCDMDPILDLARDNNLAVIEDCAQAHGARYKNKSVGSFGEIGAWSFCQDKIITTAGEGGMITTNDPELWDRMWSYKDHGKSWDSVYDLPLGPGFRWVHDSFGTNGRMLEIQSVVGRIQLTKLEEWSAKRRANACEIWKTANETIGLRAGAIPSWATHAAYKAYVFIEPDALKGGWTRNRILAEINDAGVPCSSGSSPEIYLENAFNNTGWRPATRLPVARELGETSLMFLVHPTLEREHIDKTCDVLRRVMRKAARYAVIRRKTDTRKKTLVSEPS